VSQIFSRSLKESFSLSLGLLNSVEEQSHNQVFVSGNSMSSTGEFTDPLESRESPSPCGLASYLSDVQARTMQEKAVMLLHEAFFTKCGYIPVAGDYEDDDFESDYGLFSRYDEDHRSKSDAVNIARTELKLPGFTSNDFDYINGAKSIYEDLYSYKGKMELRAAAWFIERYSKKQEEAHRKALAKMWTFVTGYDTYHEIYMDQNELRMLTFDGKLWRSWV
jgi:hypothetical protein